jgi:hypothetical protein
MRSPEVSIVYAEHALDILEATVALIKEGKRCALVTSLAIEGGAAPGGRLTGCCGSGRIDDRVFVKRLY